MIHAELFARFVVISLVAFGGGQAALPLVERVVVQETGWLAPSTFGAAVAFSYIPPGPVLIIATFVGFHDVEVVQRSVATTRRGACAGNHFWATPGDERGATDELPGTNPPPCPTVDESSSPHSELPPR